MSFEDSDTIIARKGVNITSLYVNTTQCTSFNESNHESHVLKVSSVISIVDSMNFDGYPQLDLSYIHNNSQNDWSCGSESTHDSYLDIWADNSGLLDKTFPSLLF